MQLPSTIINELSIANKIAIPNFIAAHMQPVPTSIRINIDKCKNYPSATLAPVPWCKHAYYLPSRPVFAHDPLWHSGSYYVQEASSMFLYQLLSQKANTTQALKILDLCAAPGGKSTLVASWMNKDSLLVCNEIIKNRATVLKENCIKWGNPNVVVSNNEPKAFAALQHYFDIIIIDAPCSGSGMFRKDEKAIHEWSNEAVQKCSIRQQQILHDVLPALKPNGLLLYSTCSYSEAENENICDYIIDNWNMQSETVDITNFDGIVTTSSNKHKAVGYQFFPHNIIGEGFFVAAFTNSNIVATPGTTYTNFKTKYLQLIPMHSAIMHHIHQADNVQLIAMKDGAMACFSKSLIHELQYLMAFLNIIKSGTMLGQLINNEWLPHHELAMSNLFNSQLPTIELDLQQALQYLKCESLTNNYNLKGISTVSFDGVVLGFVKCIPNRLNNYYPKNWRLLK